MCLSVCFDLDLDLIVRAPLHLLQEPPKQADDTASRAAGEPLVDDSSLDDPVSPIDDVFLCHTPYQHLLFFL